MKVSLHTIKQFVDFDLPDIDTLVDKINRQLGGVEEVINLGEKYKGAVIVRIDSAIKHPNADRLSICMIDDGGVVKDVERDAHGHVKVVCGAPNVRNNMYAIWLPPKVTVPASYGDAQPFVLDTREIRGEMSNGMLAAADELAIGSDHSGIIDIDPTEKLPTKVKIKPGTPFAKAYGLDDYVIDIENKMFTHRPDLFGQIGVAREIAGIFGQRFKSPDWYKDDPAFENAKGLELNVFNDANEKVPRFMAVAMNNVEIQASPLWLRCALVAMGGKPINNVVDMTNYIMLMTAQPTHAYDYGKLHGHTLGVRMAKKNEKATLLNGKTYELSEDDIVIVDDKGIVGLGGIMGGGNSEVSADTKNIVLEVANFDMYTVRKSSMRHGLFTDALTRFNKGQSHLQANHVLGALMENVKDMCDATQASDVQDTGGVLETDTPVSVSAEFINERLGVMLSRSEITQLLENVEMIVSDKDALRISPPFWRTDIEISEDIVEEVGRLYGFDKLPRELPTRSLKAAPKNARAELKRKLRDQLRLSGANEVLTYSFVHEKTLLSATQDTSHAYKITNALSPDLQYYRLSLAPSLLDKIHMNIKAGYDEFALFEINKVHLKNEMDETDPIVPNEDDHLAVVISYGDKKKPTGAAYYQARSYLERIVDLHNVTFTPLTVFDLSSDEWGAQLVAPYDPLRSAVIVRDGMIWGVVGEFKPNVVEAFKLPAYIAGFEIHLDIAHVGKESSYRPLSKYPSVIQDISLKVAAAVSYAQLEDAVHAATKNVSQLHIDVQSVNIYQASDDATHKTISFRVTVTSYERTMTDKDVNKILTEIEKHTTKTLKAERV